MRKLTAQEAEQCKRAFLHYDRDASGVIDSRELKVSLEAMGLQPTDAEIFVIMGSLDVDRSGGIEYAEFVRIIERQLAQQACREDEADTVEAFVALGGKGDRSGCVSVEKLRQTIKDFELTIDIERMLAEMDKDSNGTVEYGEFKLLLSA